MHFTDLLWWLYLGFVLITAIFFIVFAWLVTKKGGHHG
jgi:hypothetical protein